MPWQVKERLMVVFCRYGFPERILCDNGSPWGGAEAACPYTEFSVWLLRLGVEVIATIKRAPRGLFRFGCHRCHAGMLKPALGGNREYFHAQTIGDSDRLEARGTLNFI